MTDHKRGKIESITITRPYISHLKGWRKLLAWLRWDVEIEREYVRTPPSGIPPSGIEDARSLKLWSASLFADVARESYFLQKFDNVSVACVPGPGLADGKIMRLDGHTQFGAQA